MIIVNEISEKLQKVLNGTDSETQSIVNPTDFNYVVATQGFHLDNIKGTNGGNFIPVFVSNFGGEFNPIPDLLEQDVVATITLYFPVRLKNDMFALNEFLAKCFVGKYLTWGTISGKCVSNISVAQYGEIEQINLKEYKDFVASVYRQDVKINEPFMSMTFNLYLSNMASGFVYGNECEITLTYGATSFKPVFVQSSIQSSSETSGQQLLGATIPEVSGLPMNTAYGNGFAIYYKNETIYNTILTDFFDGKIQQKEFTVKYQIGTLVYQRTCFVSSVNTRLEKGEAITITFTFSKKV